MQVQELSRKTKQNSAPYFTKIRALVLSSKSIMKDCSTKFHVIVLAFSLFPFKAQSHEQEQKHTRKCSMISVTISL